MSQSQQIANRLREVLLSGKWIANTNYKEQIIHKHEFIEIDRKNLKLSVMSKELGQVGNYTMTLETKLQDYIDVNIKVDFKIEVRDCEVTSLVSTDGLGYTTNFV